MQLSFDKMMELVDNKPELNAKQEWVNGIPVIIFSYTVAMTNTFDSELAREFRGTTFREDTKELISRPLPKFFNVGERPDTQFDQICWNKARYYTKFDGSLAIPVNVEGKIHWKTKRSFFSGVAKQIQDFWNRNNWMTHPNAKDGFNNRSLLSACRNYTPMFEYIGPTNQIVLEYEEECLHYLGFRNNDTGEFIPCIRNECFNLPYEAIKNMQDIEGFVIDDGKQLVKAKTQWYIDRHKLCTEFSHKAIIRATLNETVNDLIASIYQLGLPERAKRVEKLRDEVNETLLEEQQTIQCVFQHANTYSEGRKDFARVVKQKIAPVYHKFVFLLFDSKDYTPSLHKHVFDLVYEKYKESA